jgi:uncharacterized protein (DUF302 family)
MIRSALLTLFLFVVLVPGAPGADSRVYIAETSAGMDETYKAVYRALEEARFWVVFEADMGAQMARFSAEWGDDYNRNGLEAVRTMVACNAWWTNRVANADPDMLAFCPLRVALTHKAGTTRVMFERPTLMAAHSPALPVMEEIEAELKAAVDTAVASVSPR